jgi:hypothetical protein
MRHLRIYLCMAIAFGFGLGEMWAFGNAQGANQWLHFRTADDLAQQKWSELPSAQVHTVAPEARSEAVKLLSDRAYSVLNNDELRRFAPMAETPQVGFADYLVRAVKNTGTDGVFKVLSDGRSVVVQHGSLAKHSSWEKDALIVELAKPPTRVFVEVSVAE